MTKFLESKGLAPEDASSFSKQDILDIYDSIQDDKQKKEELGKKIELRSRNSERPVNRNLALPMKQQEGAFIDSTGKFAIVGAAKKNDRRVISIADFSRNTTEDRNAEFVAGRPVFRRGDTVVKDLKAFVIGGMNEELDLLTYPVNASARDRRIKMAANQNVTKVTCDVLGRRLYGRGADSRNLEPAPYPLRG
ncbi:MAG: hypothetical protein OXH59_14600 [Rhodospirillaceae bacterium]|nr:hypothetical protein [Rhodospirillaceae bacterium]